MSSSLESPFYFNRISTEAQCSQHSQADLASAGDDNKNHVARLQLEHARGSFQAFVDTVLLGTRSIVRITLCLLGDRLCFGAVLFFLAGMALHTVFHPAGGLDALVCNKGRWNSLEPSDDDDGHPKMCDLALVDGKFQCCFRFFSGDLRSVAQSSLLLACGGAHFDHRSSEAQKVILGRHTRALIAKPVTEKTEKREIDKF